MSLTIRSLELRDFRNYQCFALRDIGELTVFAGRNAVGKSNIVEAVQLVTALSSFRHAPTDHLVREGSGAAQVRARLSDGSRELDVELRIEEGRKRYLLNGKGKRTADLRLLAPAVVFTPDDLELVKGSHSGRRAALDALGSQLSSNHRIIKRDYENVIRHKNRLLKEGADGALLDSIDEMVVTVGAQLTCYRAALVQKLAPLLEERYAALSRGREHVGVRYVPSWERETDDFEGDDALAAGGLVGSAFAPDGSDSSGAFGRDEARERLRCALDSRRVEEVARCRAVVGPHADKLELLIEGRPAGAFGSQGQQRTIVLAYKLAEVALVEEMLGQKPVLLLDDVMSELDEARRAALVELIEHGAQTFVTTANLAYFDDAAFAHARVVHLPLVQDEEGAGR